MFWYLQIEYKVFTILILYLRLTLTGSGEGWVVASREGSCTLTQWNGSNVHDVRSHFAHVSADL